MKHRPRGMREVTKGISWSKNSGVGKLFSTRSTEMKPREAKVRKRQGEGD